jgi:hypothetical protein
MIRRIALPALAILAACSFGVPAQAPEQSEPDAARYEGWVQDLRKRESLQRNLEAERVKAGTQIKLTDGDVLPLFSGAPSATRETVLQVCHAAGGVVGIEVWTWAEGAGAGPQHQSVQKVTLAPGTCVFASGALVEARASGFSGEDARIASQWMKERIASLEAEPQSPTRDEKLEYFRSRTKLPPASTVSFEIASR